MAETITGLADLGFGMTVRYISELVQSYVQHSDDERGKKTIYYKGKQGYPEPDWMSSFIKNNNLSSKQATILSTTRYNATKNPFVIYHFYDRLDLIWNCSESGLPHEPTKLKIITPKGHKTLLVRTYCNTFHYSEVVYIEEVRVDFSFFSFQI